MTANVHNPKYAVELWYEGFMRSEHVFDTFGDALRFYQVQVSTVERINGWTVSWPRTIEV